MRALFRAVSLVVVIALFGLVAGDEPARCQTVNVWLTTDDQSHLLQPQTSVAFSTGSGGTNCVVVDETQTYQQIEGFGAAFTDTTGYILNEVATPSARTNALLNLFTRSGTGVGLSFMRLPMGACDLARSQYSYDDLPAGQTDTNLVSFSIAHDLVDLVPLIQQARQLNPQLEIMANPWSPPGWMKTSGSMVGGSLLPAMYTPFANYFVKFIQAYRGQGIPINYIGLQNEPLFLPADYPGMSMEASTQMVVLRDYVLPALTANQLTNKVLVYDHNWDTPSYPQTVFSDPTVLASTQVAGIAWHGYGGTPGVMLALAAQYPAKGNYETEHSGGTWTADQVRSDFEEIIQVMRSWGKTYLKWNLAANQSDGPNTGGCSDCTPLVTVNTNTGAVSYNVDFYTLGHFSKFVVSGAYRVYSANAAGVLSAAFLNPDGSKVLVVFNDTGATNSFRVQWGSQSFAYTLPAYSGATFTWVGTRSGACLLNPANQLQASSFNAVSNLETEQSSDDEGGYDVGYASGGSYAVYPDVNLGSGFTNVSARLASENTGGTLDFYVDSTTGPLLGSVSIPDTGGWQTWQTQAGSLTGGSGLHNLYVVYNGGSGIGNLNWFQFGGALPPLPAPWTNADVGAVGLAGGAGYANGTFTVNGSGADIWNAADEFQFVNQPVAGACEIRARVDTVLETDPWAKAGVMLRDSAAAGAINAAVVVTPGNGAAFQVRAATGASTTSTAASGVTAPRWVRLARSAGNSFAAYYSSDGANWTPIGGNTSIPLTNAALAGLVVTAHNNASNCVATFDSVSVNQAPVLAAIPNQTILAGRVLAVTNAASDADVPAQTLSYGLAAAPSGAAINANTGVLTWRPAVAQSPSTQTVAVVVSDNGLPVMSATQSFLVDVTRPAPPVLNLASMSGGNFTFWFNGETGPDYTIEASTNLASWSAIATVHSPSLPYLWADTNAVAFHSRFYRALLGP
jgi:glucosylceramidase